jgi:poly-gamma-glutamate synthesis protein (capsule biosynthesis protein)
MKIPKKALIPLSLFFLILLSIGAFLLYQFFTNQNLHSLIPQGSNFISANIAEHSKPITFENSREIRTVKNGTRLLFFGDTALLDPLGPRVKADPNYTPFYNVLEEFKRYDYIVGSLEVPIDGDAVGTAQVGKNYTFTTPKESVLVYKNAGIDAFAYSSNHTKDYGPSSVTHTIELLKAQGIPTFGSGANNEEAYKPLYVTVNDVKIAFVAYNCMEWAFNHATDTEPGTASFVEWRVREVIGEAKNNADVVIVFSHWGNEHTTELDPDWQIYWADVYTSAGADLVIGAHPHVIQEHTLVNGKPVYYSVGNFMFPGMDFDPNSLNAIAVEIVIEDKKISETIEHKVYMDGEGVPKFVD